MRMRAGAATVVVVVVVMAMLAGSSAWSAPAHSAPAHSAAAPATWDPAIAPLAETVARIRGLEWKHPVTARFLDDAEFDALLQQGTELDSATRNALEQELRRLRALGLAPGIARVDDLFGTPDTSNVLAFYDDDKQEIVVRGTTLDVAHRATLVHELTHALDDQHFDLGGVGKASTNSAAIGRDELIEGDASRVEDLYVAELSADEQAELETEQEAQGAAEGNGAISYNPDFLVALQNAPYLLGPTMVATMAGTRGPSSVDAAFRTPPRDDEAGFNPFVAAYPHERVKVAPPRLAKGEHQLMRGGAFGPLSLYLVLASRIDRVQALRAVDGWAGDSIASLRRGKQLCLRDTVAGHTRADARRLRRALRAYADALPDGAASVTSEGTTVTLTACDAGRKVKTPSAYARSALLALDLRNEVVSAALTGGVSRTAAKCAADDIVEDPLFRHLVASTAQLTDEQRTGVRNRYHQILQGCIAHR